MNDTIHVLELLPLLLPRRGSTCVPCSTPAPTTPMTPPPEQQQFAVFKPRLQQDRHNRLHATPARRSEQVAGSGRAQPQGQPRALQKQGLSAARLAVRPYLLLIALFFARPCRLRC